MANGCHWEYRVVADTEAHARDHDPDEHLTLDTVVCLGLHVEEKANQYVAVISTQSLLLNPIRALLHGMVREVYGDATHKISHQLIKQNRDRCIPPSVRERPHHKGAAINART
jgi:hypothetical protein